MELTSLMFSTTVVHTLCPYECVIFSPRSPPQPTFRCHVVERYLSFLLLFFWGGAGGLSE